MKKLLLTITAFISFNTYMKAQEFETILLAKEDASKLTNAYVNPVMKGLIYSMNNGWYHTAKVHKKFGFDISIGVNGSFIPSKDEIFDLTKIGLSDATTYNQNTTPTIAGDGSDTATLTYEGTVQSQNVSVDFDMPSGIKGDLPASAVPAPSVQIGIGLPYKLEAIVRYVPKVGSDDTKAGLFGLGLKKEITSWFGPMDKTPLHVSLLAAYTNMNVDYNIGNTVNGNVSTQDASTEFNLNSYTIQAIASINFPIINFYGGVGFNGGSTSLKMLGDYTLTYETGNPLAPTVQESVSDPLSLTTSVNGFNATVGTRLSLGFFKIYGSYTLQEYNTVNAGIAFSFR